MNDCPKCQGSGWYKYDENHSTVCDACCKHEDGWWPLTPHHHGYVKGENNECCLRGCGKMKREYIP